MKSYRVTISIKTFRLTFSVVASETFANVSDTVAFEVFAVFYVVILGSEKG